MLWASFDPIVPVIFARDYVEVVRLLKAMFVLVYS
jgi:hypothetical protein